MLVAPIVYFYIIIIYTWFEAFKQLNQHDTELICFSFSAKAQNRLHFESCRWKLNCYTRSFRHDRCKFTNDSCSFICLGSMPFIFYECISVIHPRKCNVIFSTVQDTVNSIVSDMLQWPHRIVVPLGGVDIDVRQAYSLLSPLLIYLVYLFPCQLPFICYVCVCVLCVVCVYIEQWK